MNAPAPAPRAAPYLEVMDLLVFRNMLVFLQRCPSDKRRQLRISKEFKRLPDGRGRLLRPQLHPQGRQQQVLLPPLLLGAGHGRAGTFRPRPGLSGRHFGTGGCGLPAHTRPAASAMAATGSAPRAGAAERRLGAGMGRAAGGEAGGEAGPAASPSSGARPRRLRSGAGAGPRASRRPARGGRCAGRGRPRARSQWSPGGG